MNFKVFATDKKLSYYGILHRMSDLAEVAVAPWAWIKAMHIEKKTIAHVEGLVNRSS
jgi:hypothetical protein